MPEWKFGLVLGSPVQDRHGCHGVSPAKGREDHSETEACVI